MTITREPIVRFLSHIEKLDNGCWLWTASKSWEGYGHFRRAMNEGMYKAHRFSYEYYKGEIPNGLTIDHLCRNTSCVNPEHLEAVTNRVNIMRGETNAAINARKTRCIHDHEFTPQNTKLTKNPKGGYRRSCRICNRKTAQKHREKTAKLV